MMGKIKAISVSRKKGIKKENIESCELKENHGIVGDAHAGDWHRQVSLLSFESIENFSNDKLKIKPGEFAENITTEGINLNLSIGAKIKLGGNCMLEITQIGKECHDRCNIYYTMGDCIMPKQGIFAKVLKGGTIKIGDSIELL